MKVKSIGKSVSDAWKIIAKKVGGTITKLADSVNGVVTDIKKQHGYPVLGPVQLRDDYWMRPVDAYVPMGVQDVAKMPLLPIDFRLAYDMYHNCDVLKTVIRVLTWEIFRNGLYVKEKFAVKCAVCGAEYKDERKKQCDVCGSNNFIRPDIRGKRKLEEWIRRCNKNNESLIDVLRQCAVDLAVLDNAFLVVRKEYYFNENGEVVAAKPIEVLRGSPFVMRIIINRMGEFGKDDNGNYVMFCLQHRRDVHILGEKEAKNARCPKCGKKLVPAWYEMVRSIGGGNTYYAGDEVLHFKLFTEGIGYGYPPVIALFMKVMILIKMDWFILMSYHLQRPPRGLLIIKGQREAIAKAWEWLMEQARLNPHMVYPLIVEGDASATRRVAEWIDMSFKSKDIDFISFRDELRRAIGCYDEETEVLTKRGWKRWDEVTEEDEVLCYEPVTERLYWAKIKEKYVYDYDGWMFKLKAKGYDLLISPEHRIIYYKEREYLDGKLVPVERRIWEVGKKLRGVFPVAGIWTDGNNFDELEITVGRERKKIKVNGKELLKFVGFYVAEGWRSKDGYYKVRVTQKNEENLRWIRELLGKLGFNWYEIKKDGGIELTINCKDLHDWLAQFGDGAKNKRIPRWLLELKREYLEVFLEGYLRGDGHRRNDGRFAITTMSKELADGLQELLIKLGYGAQMYVNSSNGSYCIETSSRFKYLRGDQGNVELVWYKGKIWDVNVGGGWIVVRRNGKVAISGNSMYGVLPLWHGDVGGVGVANQGLQMVVTNRAVEVWQTMFNEKVLPWLTRQLGITDWVIQVKPHEERDIAAQLQRIQMRLQIAKMVEALGYKVRLKEGLDGIEFDFEERDIDEELADIIEKLRKELGSRVRTEDVLAILKLLLVAGDKKIVDKIKQMFMERAQALPMGAITTEERREGRGSEVVGIVGEGGRLYVPTERETVTLPEGMPMEAHRRRPEAGFEGQPRITTEGVSSERQRVEGETRLPRR